MEKRPKKLLSFGRSKKPPVRLTQVVLVLSLDCTAQDLPWVGRRQLGYQPNLMQEELRAADHSCAGNQLP